ncbi:MAG: LpxI family protein [Nitrospinota bacterium]|nr:MAG: LpxI family protein [Nitrospinota bacterium]
MAAKRLGLLAGGGELPLLVARAARAQGYSVVSIALTDTTPTALQGISERMYRLSPGQAHRILSTLRQERISEVLLIGKVNKEILFERFRFDLRALRLLFRLPNRDDDTILAAIVTELEGEGFHVLPPLHFLADQVPSKGVLTRRRPTRREWADIEYGVPLAREIGRLGIGQTIVVRDQMVLAVEALEGTDETIRRGCALGKEGAVVVKVSRPQQDLRLDMPTVGLQTIRCLAEGKAAALAIEAEKTLLVHGEEMLEEAERAGLSVVAV